MLAPWWSVHEALDRAMAADVLYAAHACAVALRRDCESGSLVSLEGLLAALEADLRELEALLARPARAAASCARLRARSSPAGTLWVTAAHWIAGEHFDGAVVHAFVRAFVAMLREVERRMRARETSGAERYRYFDDLEYLPLELARVGPAGVFDALLYSGVRDGVHRVGIDAFRAALRGVGAGEQRQ